MAIPKNLTFYVLNDQDLKFEGLTDGETGAFVNDATVTVTIYDGAGVAVPHATGVSLTYQASSDGIYVGTIPYTLNPTIGGGYVAKIDAVSVTSGHYHSEIPVTILVRTG